MQTTIGRSGSNLPRRAALAVPLIALLSAACAAQPAAPEPPQLPGVKIDRKKRIVELSGQVVLPLQAEWLELVACMPRSREHESIITLNAKPSHVHGALMLIGLEPGKPYRAEYDEQKQEWKHFPPTGDKVKITIHYETKDGKKVDVPANEWIVEQKTGKKLPDNIWVFTGSKIDQIQGKPIYRADIEGNIISLVNFGDEVLSRDTKFQGGQEGEGGDTWGALRKAIPTNGTKITLRLEPVKPKEQKKD